MHARVPAHCALSRKSVALESTAHEPVGAMAVGTPVRTRGWVGAPPLLGPASNGDTEGSPLAKKFPAPRKTGGPIRDQELLVERQAFVKIVS
eukprot:4307647-Lingulodinium_polyedra.AAC.1